MRAKVDPDATVTAGNASGQNDGAAMCVVTTASDADRLGLTPMLALRSWAVTGCGPEIMGIGPVSATAAALERAGLTLDEIDLIELNEAFAAQVLAVLAEWKVDPLDDRLNPNGSGISLGHPSRRDGRPHPGHRGLRGAQARRAHRPRDDVHRRRAGTGRGVRGRPMSAVDVHAVVTGPPDAPVVVLSNSLGSTHRMWDAQLADLEQRFPGRALRHPRPR